MSDRPNLLIFGASARAAAFSASRAGLQPWCCDLFADRDLAAHCPAMQVPGEYPEAFLDLVHTDLPGPWMYTGAMENWPGLVEGMARRRKLWGNGGGALERARSPIRVADALAAARLPHPRQWWHAQEPPPRGVRWLQKPIAGAGGRGIRFLDDEVAPLRRPEFYLQEYVTGDPCSAVYAAVGDRTHLLGVTLQLIGEPWLNAGAFHYCGNVGPLACPGELRDRLLRLGEVLRKACGLEGLFGVDGVLRQGTFWPVEVNPRYTASVEVLEYATGLRAMDFHRRAFDPAGPAPVAPGGAPPSCVGKAILYAPGDVYVSDGGPWGDVLRDPPPLTELPPFADLPRPRQRVEQGRPVLTFFARGDTPADCLARLRRTAGALDRWLEPAS